VFASAHTKWPNSKPHWATRQQAIAKTPAKWSAYQISGVIVVFVILVFKVQFVSFYSQKPQEDSNLLVTEECYCALVYMPLYTCYYTICCMYWYRLQIKWDLKNPRNRPWSLIGLRDVKDPTVSRQSAHRWRWGCQPYAPAVFCSSET
jgi:hypothetical protein